MIHDRRAGLQWIEDMLSKALEVAELHDESLISALLCEALDGTRRRLGAMDDV